MSEECCCGQTGGPQPGFCDLPTCVRVELSGIAALKFRQCAQLIRGGSGCPNDCRVGPGPFTPEYSNEIVSKLIEDYARSFAGFEGGFELPRVEVNAFEARYKKIFPARWFQWTGVICESCDPAAMSVANNGAFIRTAADGIEIEVLIQCADTGPTVTIWANAMISDNLFAIIEGDPPPGTDGFSLASELFEAWGIVAGGDESITLANTIPPPIVNGTSIDFAGGNPDLPCSLVVDWNESLVGGGSAIVSVPGVCGAFPDNRHNYARKCDGTGEPIIVDFLATPLDTVTVLKDDERYLILDTPVFDPADSVVPSPLPCPSEPPQPSGVKIAEACEPSSVFPAEIGYIPLPAIGAGQGGVRFYFNNLSTGCVTIRYYRPTDRDAPDGMAAVGEHYAGVACALPSVTVCDTPDPQPINLNIICAPGGLCWNLPADPPAWLATLCARCGPRSSSIMSLAAVAEEPETDEAITPSLATRAISFGRAIISGRGAPPDVVETRRRSCFGDPANGIAPCPSLRGEVGSRWCGDCGCGDRARAMLDADPRTGKSKLDFVELTCPRRRAGFSNATPSRALPATGGHSITAESANPENIA